MNPLCSSIRAGSKTGAALDKKGIMSISRAKIFVIQSLFSIFLYSVPPAIEAKKVYPRYLKLQIDGKNENPLNIRTLYDEDLRVPTNNPIISKATGVLDELAFRGYVTISIFAVYKLQLLIKLFLNVDLDILKFAKKHKPH